MADVAQTNSGPNPPSSAATSSPRDRDPSAEEKSIPPRPQSRDKPANGLDTKQKQSKKRRKVNHACVYCRRSHMTCDQERPCSRCIKRNIGHLCHDEPREHKRGKHDQQNGNHNHAANGTALPETTELPAAYSAPELTHPEAGNISLAPAVTLTQAANPAQLSRTNTDQAQPVSGDQQPFVNYNDWNHPSAAQNQPSDVQNFHPNYMFSTSEVSNEYNLLNDFLSTSMLDDAFYQDTESHSMFSDPSLANIMGPLSTPNNAIFATTPQMNPANLIQQQNSEQPPSAKQEGNPALKDKEKETAYFLTAADPAGTEAPEERMAKLFKAKYDAGLLKPWNYVKGYARLYKWMEANISKNTRMKIMRQMERFRPEFRKRVQSLNDYQLVLIEIWFERKLMEYDRIFASMAIPACCWRRTGEIFRGNREMSELIGVPLDELRDGKLSLHQILTEQSLGTYWEKFTSIAFDTTQKAILTGCILKKPNASPSDPELSCCFSFTVVRDHYDIPTIICGNFLPIPDS